MVAVYHLIVFSVLPLMFYFYQDSEGGILLTKYPIGDYFAEILLIPFIQLCFIVLGYHFPLGRKLPFPFLIHRNPKQITSLVLFVGLFFMGLLSYVVWIRLAGGIGNLLENMEYRYKILALNDAVGYGWVFYLLNLLVLLPLLYFTWFNPRFSHSKTPTFSYNKKVVGFVVISFFVFFILLLLGGRSRALLPLILSLVFYHYAYRRLTLRQVLRAAFYLFVVVVLVGILRGYQMLSTSLTLSDLSIIIDEISPVAVLLHFSKTQSLLILFHNYPKNYPFEGYGVLLAGLAPILSRAGIQVSPSHGSLMGSLLFGEAGRSSFPLPLCGEQYLAAGIPGVVLGSLIYGVWIKWLYVRITRFAGNSSCSALYAFIFFYFIFSVLHGGFTVLFDTQTIFLFLILLAVLYISGFKLRAGHVARG